MIQLVQNPPSTLSTVRLLFFQVDGTPVYKASIVKSLFSSEPLSRDRLRKVRGMTKYTETSSPSESIETAIMPGDPILINIKGELKIAKITLVKKANRKVKFISCEDINSPDSPNILIEGNYMLMDCIDNMYVWNGSIGEKVSAIGTSCYAIQPTLKEIDGKLLFTFDKQFILDLNVQLTTQTTRKGKILIIQISQERKF